MKKKFIYLALIAPMMLISCANETISSQTSTQTQIQEGPIITSLDSTNAKQFLSDSIQRMKIAYHLDSKIKQTVYPKNDPETKQTSQSRVETYVMDKKFSAKLYNVDSSLGAFETFYKGDDNLTYSARINANNEISKRPVLHPTGNGIFNYDNEGFGNMFAELSISNFIQVTSYDYKLDLDNAKIFNLKQTIATSLYGGPGLKVKSFNIKLNKNAQINVNATLETFHGKEMDYDYSIESILSPITRKSFPDRNVLYPTIKDDYFTSKIDSLKQYNFTLKQYDYNSEGTLIKESSLFINPDKFYSQTFDSMGRPMNVGMYKDSDKYYAVVKQADEGYIRGDEVSEEVFNYYLPTLKISRDVFDKTNENTYTLKPQIDSDSTPFSRYETNADELNKTTIKFLENSIEVENSFGKYSTKIIYSDIGTTNVGYDKSSVIISPLAITNWNEIFSEQQINKMSEFLSGDIDSLPFPTMLKDATSFALGFDKSSNQMQVAYTSAAIPSKPSDIKFYNNLLVNAGWEPQQDSNDERGHLAKTINGQDYLTLVDSDGSYFYISIFKV